MATHHDLPARRAHPGQSAQGAAAYELRSFHGRACSRTVLQRFGGRGRNSRTMHRSVNRGRGSLRSTKPIDRELSVFLLREAAAAIAIRRGNARANLPELTKWIRLLEWLPLSIDSQVFPLALWSTRASRRAADRRCATKNLWGRGLGSGSRAARGLRRLTYAAPVRRIVGPSFPRTPGTPLYCRGPLRTNALAFRRIAFLG